MNTEKAKELLKDLGINPEFNVLEWNEVFGKLRNAQVNAYDIRLFDRGELLCDLERFISDNGGDLRPWPIDSYFHASTSRTVIIGL